MERNNLREKQFRKVYLRTVEFGLTVAQLCIVILENPKKENNDSSMGNWSWSVSDASLP